MKKRFRSLLIERAELRLPGLQVKRFAVHRHLPEVTLLRMHQHPWTQVLLYLDGRGIQCIGKSEIEVSPGVVFVIPPHVPHAFVRRGKSRPLCVMIDAHLRGAAKRRERSCQLQRSELLEVRQRVASLVSTHPVGESPLRLDSAVLLLQILQVVFRSAQRSTPEAVHSSRQPSASSLRGSVEQLDLAEPLKAVVARSGYQKDHYNRLLKQQTGLTLGQHRARQRLAAAQALLAQGHLVSSAATTVGLLDQAYFARWFRRQTGVTPSQWRDSAIAARASSEVG